MNKTVWVILLAAALGIASSAWAERRQPENETSLQLLRNATMRLNFAGHVFLTDPMLSQKGEIQPFAGVASNPTVDLPMSVDEILTGVDAVVVSHLHPDHFHRAAEQAVLKTKPVFCQPEDEAQIRSAGFENVIPVAETINWNGITITRFRGQHGTGPILEMMGTVSGFVFQAKNEPTILWSGDTIWCPPVAETVRRFNPDFILTHSGGAQKPGFEPIVMDARQTIETARSAPQARIIAIHMEALDHCRVRRQDLRDAASAAGIASDQLIIPEDGQTIPLRIQAQANGNR